MKRLLFASVTLVCLAAMLASAQDNGAPAGHVLAGKRLFESATFGGNGRTCQTCHDPATGTLSPEAARQRFEKNPGDPLFLHDGSDDFQGHGVSRILADATMLVNVPLAPNVSLADDPDARFVTLRRGVASTINTPAIDKILMSDGRQPSLEAQAAGAIADHAEGVVPSFDELQAIAEFQKTNAFFSSPEIRKYALGGAAPELPAGRSDSEKRGRRFFEDVPPDLSQGLKPGLCAHCHSGAMLDTTNQFAKFFIPSPAPIPAGQRFLSVGVSEFNAAGNPVREFVFDKGTPQEAHVFSPDAGRALTTGIVADPTFEHVNAFKISPLRGVRKTAPYFHDNSAKTLEDVARHYAALFFVTSGGLIQLTPQDEADMVAYMKLLD